ncbi:serine hydrolase [Pseudomonas sp. RC10]|uniref:serine hydrolase domain-containing protein n=1 Tax=Pseudomonas bambusae TaxID=3139142 RepID=UPI00313875F0
MPVCADPPPAVPPSSRFEALQRGSPSQLGVDPDRIVSFLDDVEDAGLDLHGLILQRHGSVIAEGWKWPYSAEKPRVLHSVAKSFTACAIGFAVSEGLMQLSDKVVSFFPEHLPADVHDRLSRMTVEHLLTMRTGHASNTSGAVWRQIQTSWIAEFFKIPLVYEPGEHYVYTSAASYMLSAIITRLTGLTLHQYLRPRLFMPLGIHDDHWEVGPDGINPGGNGLTAPPSAMLKLGMLHAQRGMWEGQRILPEDWIDRATQPQGGSDSQYGYHWAIKPKDAYCAVGVFVQMSIVYAQHGATLVLVGAMKNSAQIRPHIERHFPEALTGVCQPAVAADQRLTRRLEAMGRVPVLTSQARGRLQSPATLYFEIDDNELGVRTLGFAFENDTIEVVVHDATGEHVVVAGIDRWHHGTTSMPGQDLHHGYALDNAEVIAGGCWMDDATLQLQWIYPGCAFRDTVVCTFTEDTLRYERNTNVNSGRLRHPALRGKRQRR